MTAETRSMDERREAQLRELFQNVAMMRALPGYPFLPCPICHGIEGCDHSVPERARGYGHNLMHVGDSNAQ